MPSDNNAPAILKPALAGDAGKVLPGSWLEEKLAQTSAHWRLANENPLLRADAALRALFLVAYRKLSSPGPKPAPTPSCGGPLIQAGPFDPAQHSSFRQGSDERFDEGFHDEVRAHSLVLAAGTPAHAGTDLLEGFSEFVRFDAPGLSSQRAPAARILEEIWEQMDIGWVN